MRWFSLPDAEGTGKRKTPASVLELAVVPDLNRRDLVATQASWRVR